jgi:hypothetical protein
MSRTNDSGYLTEPIGADISSRITALITKECKDNTCLVTGATDDRGENSAGSIVTGETGLAHTRAVVNDQGSDLQH